MSEKFWEREVTAQREVKYNAFTLTPSWNGESVINVHNAFIFY